MSSPATATGVDLGLVSNIQEIWEASGHTYGADRVHRQLRRDGIRVGRRRVERQIGQRGRQGAFRRRGCRGGSTKQDPTATPAPDLVNYQSTAAGRNRLWPPTPPGSRAGRARSGWPRSATPSRRIVGWKTSDRCGTDLMLAALEYGVWSRDIRDSQLIHHSDRSSNYTSFRFSERLRDNGILPSWATGPARLGRIAGRPVAASVCQPNGVVHSPCRMRTALPNPMMLLPNSSSLSTAARASNPCSKLIRATAPAICGAANDVPLQTTHGSRSK